MLPPATPAAASPAPAESFGSRCAKAACLKNIIVMGALQALADCIDAEIAAFKREKAAASPSLAPSKVEDFGDRKKIPPSPDQVAAYSASIGYPLDGAEFCDSYAAKGWAVGRAKMKDWQSAVRNWKRNGWGHVLRGTGHDPKPRRF